MKAIAGTTLLLFGLLNCAKVKPQVPPCDEDLGYLSSKHHLANVQYLDENRSIDWFELYENLEERRTNTAPQKCIPGSHAPTTEQAIEREEHGLRNLR